MEIKLKPIGVIHSPYKTKQEMPIQAYASKEVAEIEVFKEYVDGLKDIEGFSHIILLYWFHKSKGYSLHVNPSWIRISVEFLPVDIQTDQTR